MDFLQKNQKYFHFFCFRVRILCYPMSCVFTIRVLACLVLRAKHKCTVPKHTCAQYKYER